MRSSKIHFFIISSLLIVIFSSCGREDEHPVPDVYVDFTINLMYDPEFYFLQTQGSSAIIYSSTIGIQNLGYNDNGVIIYNNGFYEFYAFDCTCPYDLPSIVAVELSEINGVAECPVCGTQYVFPSMGVPTYDGPGQWPLKEYNTLYNPNTGDLLITN